MNRKEEIRGLYEIKFPSYRVFVPTLSIRTESSNALCPAFMIRLQPHRKMRGDDRTVLYRHIYDSMAACAAANRAIGTLNGEQLT